MLEVLKDSKMNNYLSLAQKGKSSAFSSLLAGKYKLLNMNYFKCMHCGLALIPLNKIIQPHPFMTFNQLDCLK